MKTWSISNSGSMSWKLAKAGENSATTKVNEPKTTISSIFSRKKTRNKGRITRVFRIPCHHKRMIFDSADRAGNAKNSSSRPNQNGAEKLSLNVI